MYRNKEEQKEMSILCEKFVDYIFDAYNKKELDRLAFISKCSFACGFCMPLMARAENMNLWKS